MVRGSPPCFFGYRRNTLPHSGAPIDPADRPKTSREKRLRALLPGIEKHTGFVHVSHEIPLSIASIHERRAGQRAHLLSGWLVRLTSREAVPSAAKWYEISPPGITYVPGGIVDAPRGRRAAVSRQSLGCDFATMDRKARSCESASYGSTIGIAGDPGGREQRSTPARILSVAIGLGRSKCDRLPSMMPICAAYEQRVPPTVVTEVSTPNKRYASEKIPSIWTALALKSWSRAPTMGGRDRHRTRRRRGRRRDQTDLMRWWSLIPTDACSFQSARTEPAAGTDSAGSTSPVRPE